MSGSQPSSETTNGWNGLLKREYLRTLGKRGLIGELIGWQSIWRTIRHEDSLARRDAEAYHKALHGDDRGDAAEEDMSEEFSGNLILGDMTVNPNPPPRSNGKRFAKAALLGASLLGAGGIGAVVMSWLNSPPVTSEDTDTQHRWGPGEWE